MLGMVDSAAPQGRGRVPVLVELFTSEGCSSCPPADVLLEKLDRAQPVPEAEILVLSEHVDYWNSLGWKDPFSSHEFSSRQEAYGRRFRLDGVYTPQMVVDGSSEFVGSDSRHALAVIGQAARVEKVQMRILRIQPTAASPANLRVEVSPGHSSGDVYLAVAENRASSQVLRGENRGRSLQHVAVVRRIQSIGNWNGRTPFAKDVVAVEAATTTVRLIAFVQESGEGRVVAATMLGASQ
jgi:hypothetical protein